MAYNAAYPEGTRVQIVSRQELESFQITWAGLHHNVQTEQMEYANRTAAIEQIVYYHGGDVLY